MSDTKKKKTCTENNGMGIPAVVVATATTSASKNKSSKGLDNELSSNSKSNPSDNDLQQEITSALAALTNRMHKNREKTDKTIQLLSQSFQALNHKVDLILNGSGLTTYDEETDTADAKDNYDMKSTATTSKSSRASMMSQEEESRRRYFKAMTSSSDIGTNAGMADGMSTVSTRSSSRVQKRKNQFTSPGTTKAMASSSDIGTNAGMSTVSTRSSPRVQKRKNQFTSPGSTTATTTTSSTNSTDNIVTAEEKVEEPVLKKKRNNYGQGYYCELGYSFDESDFSEVEEKADSKKPKPTNQSKKTSRKKKKSSSTSSGNKKKKTGYSSGDEEKEEMETVSHFNVRRSNIINSTKSEGDDSNVEGGEEENQTPQKVPARRVTTRSAAKKKASTATTTSTVSCTPVIRKKEAKRSKSNNDFNDSPTKPIETPIASRPKTTKTPMKNGNPPSSEKRNLSKFRQDQADFWNTRYKELIQYKKENGDCLVPTHIKPLGIWVKFQRDEYKRYVNKEQCGMTPERILALDNIGFIYNPLQHFWDTKFKELLEFKKEHNHCMVSTGKGGGGLGGWVNSQRKHYRKYQQNLKSPITEEKIRVLDSVGFVWEPAKLKMAANTIEKK